MEVFQLSSQEWQIRTSRSKQGHVVNDNIAGYHIFQVACKRKTAIQTHDMKHVIYFSPKQHLNQ